MDEKALAFAKSIAYSSENVVDHVYNVTKRLINNEIPGSFIECGVAAGSKIIAMIAALNEFPCVGYKVHAFDSFQGIPLPTQNDDQQPGIRMLSAEEMNNLPYS